jgi:NADH-quinone oxidoreductase subunit G
VLRYRYGAEGQLLAGLLNVIVSENLANADFVAARTTGYDELKSAIQPYDADTVASRTGLSAEAIRGTARAIAQAKDAVFVYGRELPDAAKGLLEALVLVTGHAGRANNGVLPILAHNNTQGVRALMPAHTASRARALVVMGAQAERDGAEFMLVQDLFLTPTAQQADVVLPAQSWAERDGTYTNYERRVQHFEPGMMPIGESRPDWRIVALLANELDASWNYSGAGSVFAEIAAKVAAFAGMSYAKLSGKLIRTRSHFLYEGTSFESAGGQGQVYPSAAENAETKFALAFHEPAVPEDGGMTLVGARVLYDAGTLISETSLLQKVTPASYADLNRADAERLNVQDGDTVRLTSAHGSVDVAARVDGRAPAGVIVAPINLKPSDTRTLFPLGQVTTPVTIEKTLA